MATTGTKKSLGRLQKALRHGLFNVGTAQFKKAIFYIFYKIYRFDKWHSARPFETTNYKKIIVDAVDSIINENSTTVDVGCGTGEILRHLKKSNRIGIDIDTNALKLGKLLNAFIKPPIIYHEGSLSKVSELNINIDVLIATNWLHRQEDEWISENLTQLFESSAVKYFVVDEFPHQKDRIKNLFEKFGDVASSEVDWQDGKIIYVFKIRN